MKEAEPGPSCEVSLGGIVHPQVPRTRVRFGCYIPLINLPATPFVKPVFPWRASVQGVWYVCLCVHLCKCVRVHGYVCLCTMYAYVGVCLGMAVSCMCICMCECVCMCAFMYGHVRMHVCVCARTSLSLFCPDPWAGSVSLLPAVSPQTPGSRCSCGSRTSLSCPRASLQNPPPRPWSLARFCGALGASSGVGGPLFPD